MKTRLAGCTAHHRSQYLEQFIKAGTAPAIYRQQEKTNDHVDLVPKRKAASVVWNYFGYSKDDIDQTQVLGTCPQCLVVVATTRGNTTNLFDHLNRHHKAQYYQCKARSEGHPKQQSISDALARVAPYEKGSKRQREITDAITLHLAKDMAPTNTVPKRVSKT